MVANGMSQRDIAKALGISQASVSRLARQDNPETENGVVSFARKACGKDDDCGFCTLVRGYYRTRGK
jgi:predicted transcriptional regulator